LAGDGIRANAVAPAEVATPVYEAVMSMSALSWGGGFHAAGGVVR